SRSRYVTVPNSSANFNISFFFQAEDGIRDPLVTGVQTCALPIFAGDETRFSHRHAFPRLTAILQVFAVTGRIPHQRTLLPFGPRSEERRVGKECRSRWWQ